MSRARNLKVSIWDPRVDLYRMWMAFGLSRSEVDRKLQIHQRLSKLWESKGFFAYPPPIALRLLVAKTQEARALTAALAILALRVQARPIPPCLRIYENFGLTGPHRVARIRKAMYDDNARPQTTDYYVVQELCPALLLMDFIHVPNASYWRIDEELESGVKLSA